ncbi:MAG: 50S ribosomal protein L5 [Alphaproteobacteria bacterium]|nr:50S ribosomal protein L5 [Alphaproteobacteria bacterium]OJV16375.1 MAG: 50S ribosomal protein L5 [Alphaproteobacteria bacterium 33-17]
MATKKVQKFKDLYKASIIKQMVKEFGYKNVMEVPKLEKVVINMGVGEAVQNSKVIDNAVSDLAAISAQKPLITRSKKSISSFKLRENMPIGCKVTLRGDSMYSFLERFILVSLPRLRDFRGYSAKSFDGKGNFTIGVKEQIVFPEIDYDKIDAIRGMDITIVTTAKTDVEAKELLSLFHVPFLN